MCRDLYEISSHVHSDQSCLLLLSPIWARKILLSVLILIFIFPEISSIFAMSSSSFEDICSTTFSKQQRQMFKKKTTSHIEHVPMNIPANKMLKILEEKTNQKPQQVNSATFRSFMLSVFLCISLYMLLYYSDLRVFVVIYYNISFLLV